MKGRMKMNKKEFLDTLRKNLSNLPNEEINDILYDYEEHFNVGLERGKSEYDISKELGNPIKLAKSYKATILINEVKKSPNTTNVFKAVVATMALGFFNMIFILGPFLGLVGSLVGLYGASIGITMGGLGMIFAPILKGLFTFSTIISINPIACMFLGLSMTCFGLLFTILNVHISKWFFKCTIKYLNWNVDIIKK
jgi:uncharacterized membrane protein